MIRFLYLMCLTLQSSHQRLTVITSVCPQGPGRLISERRTDQRKKERYIFKPPASRGSSRRFTFPVNFLLNSMCDRRVEAKWGG